MDWLHGIFKRSPEIALFLSIAIGYFAGRLQWGTFRLGTATGTFLAALAVSQFGVHIDPGVHTVLLALFLYTAGFEAGPQFLSVLRGEGARAAAVAVVYAVAAFVTSAALAPLAGARGDGLQALGTVMMLFMALLVCGHAVPWLIGRPLLDDALQADVALSLGVPVLGPGQQAAAPEIVGRLYRVAAGPARSVADVEGADTHDPNLPPVSISRIRRGSRFVEPAPRVHLEPGDIVLVVGRREAVVARARSLGEEVHGIDGMALAMQRRDVVLTRASLDQRSIGQIRAASSASVRHGVVVVQLSRMGRVLPLAPDTVVRLHDTVSIHGAEADVNRVAALIGDPVLPTARTDMMYLAGGLVAGLLLGLPSLRLGATVLTLGAGGALISGVVFGWYRAKRQTFGAVPPGALRVVKDLGTAGLVAVVVLGAGAPALAALREQGAPLLAVAALVAVVPLLVALCAGRYLLGGRHGALLAGSLAGATLSAPVLGDVLDRTDSAVPVAPFAVAAAVSGLVHAFL
ncbi:MAG: aspartate-alanine antiporter [Rhizobacter sp.]